MLDLHATSICHFVFGIRFLERMEISSGFNSIERSRLEDTELLASYEFSEAREAREDASTKILVPRAPFPTPSKMLHPSTR